MTEQQFRDFVIEYRSKAISMARRMLKNDEDALDAVQESFIRAHRGIDKFRADSSVSTWFYRIVYTTCLNVLRSKRRMPVMEALPDEEIFASIEPELFDAMDKKTIEEILSQEMMAMPELYAVVLDLFYVQELSYEQIVKVTGMPLGTIKTRLNRGRTMLKTAMQSRLGVVSFEQSGDGRGVSGE